MVGYDGSDSARRAVARGVRIAGPRGQVILVTVEPKMPEDSIVAEPFVERDDQPSQLLAEAHAIAARTGATGATEFARLPGKAIHRTKSWRPREPPTPISSSSDGGVRAFWLARSSARWRFASSNSRAATSSSSPEWTGTTGRIPTSPLPSRADRVRLGARCCATTAPSGSSTAPREGRLAPYVRDLADALADLASSPGDRATRQEVADRALEVARRLATGYTPSEAWAVAAIVALRTVASDLMIFAGVDAEQADAAVREGTGELRVPARRPHHERDSDCAVRRPDS